MYDHADIDEVKRHIHSGDIHRAEEICNRLLAVQPGYADALHYLGVIALQQGNPDRAVELIDQAIDSYTKQKLSGQRLSSQGRGQPRCAMPADRDRQITQLKPDCADAYYNLGLALNCQGNTEDAILNFLKVLKLNPNDGHALYNLGCLYRNQGQNEKAIDFFSRTLAIEPSHASAYNNLGIVLNEESRSEEALSCYKKALEIHPDAADVHLNLGCALRKLQRFEEAVESFNKALALEPDDAAAHYNLGVVLERQGLIEKAIERFQKAALLNPGFAEAYNNLGNAFKKLGQGDKALESYRRAVAAKPDYVDAYVNMGSAYQVLGKSRQTILCCQKALEINPEFAEAYNNLGGAFCDQGDFNASRACYRKALELKPDYTEAHSNLLFSLNYDPDLTNQMMLEAARNWWQQHGFPLSDRFEHHTRTGTPRQLKIGYVSPDFRQHSVSHFFLPLIAAHDERQVEVFCYSDERHPDEITERIRKSAHHWRFIADMTDDAVARQIFEDRIDILVDLAGHTANNRLAVFARRPAPIQVTWLGYPNTTGLPVIDYRITDNVADPAGETDPYYSETLIRLPRGFLCYAPYGDTPVPASLPAFDSGTITYGSFNNLAKLNPRVIAVWSKILNGVPNSRLLLKGKQLSEELAQQKLYELFSQNGIGADRLMMMPTTKTTTEHLNLYSAVDIGLDPFPYNGTTTTCEALWMGVPVISLSGDRHAGRTGASILTQIGCDDLIAYTEKEYIKKAIELGGNLQKLTNLRAGLRLKMQNSPLCDPEGFGRTIEKSFWEMWKNWNTAADQGFSC
jgi:predicted O-linked N-acetylglucosamine transferase (SPINDLY family)